MLGSEELQLYMYATSSHESAVYEGTLAMSNITSGKPHMQGAGKACSALWGCSMSYVSATLPPPQKDKLGLHKRWV